MRSHTRFTHPNYTHLDEDRTGLLRVARESEQVFLELCPAPGYGAPRRISLTPEAQESLYAWLREHLDKPVLPVVGLDEMATTGSASGYLVSEGALDEARWREIGEREGYCEQWAGPARAYADTPEMFMDRSLADFLQACTARLDAERQPIERDADLIRLIEDAHRVGRALCWLSAATPIPHIPAAPAPGSRFAAPDTAEGEKS